MHFGLLLSVFKKSFSDMVTFLPFGAILDKTDPGTKGDPLPKRLKFVHLIPNLIEKCYDMADLFLEYNLRPLLLLVFVLLELLLKGDEGGWWGLGILAGA